MNEQERADGKALVAALRVELNNLRDLNSSALAALVEATEALRLLAAVTQGQHRE